ncbi:terminase small subunit [Blautia obeum]|uniref:terminase small subunit n=1 Tax=Blautia obeum TaxID=40520 RepID=UPI003D010A07
MTDKQKIFADEYLIDLNATRAYRKAYPNCKKDSSADAAARKLLGNTRIQKYISDRMEERQKRTEVTQDRVLQELAYIAFARVTDYATVRDDVVKIKNTDELTEEQIRAISGIKEGKFGIELKLNDKEKALELLGRHLGMWNDKLDIKTPAIDESIKEMEAYFEQQKASGSGPPVE